MPGTIAACAEAGIPSSLLISIAPHNAGLPLRANGSNPNGKAPAFVDVAEGRWILTDGWQGGQAADTRALSDQYGANCGLLCGLPSKGQTYVLMDGDLDNTDFGKESRKYFIEALSRAWGFRNLLIRNTIVPRFMLIAKIKAGGSVGSKKTIKISRTGKGEYVGKFELLTEGQQGVIAGTHQSGTSIFWTRYGFSNEYSLPPLNFPVPEFKDFDAMFDATMKAIELLSNGRLVVNVVGRTSTSDDPPPSPESLAPPDVDTWIDMIRRMPNPSTTSRDEYVSFWYAFQGTRMALMQLGRLPQEKDDEAIEAAIGWCRRYVPLPGHAEAMNHDDELAKAKRDWLHRTDINIGWLRLVTLASEFGLSDIKTELAQDEFAADTPFTPEYSDVGEGKTYTDVSIQARRAREQEYRSVEKLNRHLMQAQLSDLAIADAVESELKGTILWLSSTRQWAIYEEATGWQIDEVSNGRVGATIENELFKYAGKYNDIGPAQGEKWTRGEIVATLSNSRVRAINQRLQDRFSISDDNINCGKFILQTPNGAYDLRTPSTLPISREMQKSLRDIRCARFSPKPGKTPRFLDLIRNLSDGNPEVTEFLLSYLGYSLLGVPKAKKFVYMCGTTDNGKSALIRILQALFGNYVIALNRDVLLIKGRNEHPTALYRIRHARIACTSEMPPNEKWNTDLLKRITGGDEIQARAMHMNEKSFYSEASLLLVGNDIPSFERVDMAIARRALITHTTWRPKKPDSRFEEKLIAEEGPAIIALLMDYARKAYQRDMELPETPVTIQRYTRLYLSDQDDFFAWVDAEVNTGYDYLECEVDLDTLKSRFDGFLRRRSQESEDSGLTADKIGNKTFLRLLRSIGAKTETEDGGARLQRSVYEGGKRSTKYVVRGVALKISIVAAPPRAAAAG